MSKKKKGFLYDNNGKNRINLERQKDIEYGESNELDRP